MSLLLTTDTSCWPGIRFTLLFQTLSFLLFLCLYHAAALQALWLFAFLAYWAGILMIAIRLRKKPAIAALLFARWGFLFLFLVVAPFFTYLLAD